MSHPGKIDLAVLEKDPDIEGSVQDIFRLNIDGKPYLLCRTTESGSVFDVGKIFSVPKSDTLRTSVRHFIYVALADPDTWDALTVEDIHDCYGSEEIVKDLVSDELLLEFKKHGVLTHHVGMVDAGTGRIYPEKHPPAPTNLVLIEEYPIYHPVRFGLWGNYGWDYQEYFTQPKKIVALENVFRLGNPGGSSIQKRYNEALERGGRPFADEFLSSLGILEKLKPWGKFSNMVYECSTKYEPEDRYLSWQESLHLSGVSGELYKKVIRTLIYCTIFVSKFFRMLGLQLWDIKWEVAVDGDRVVVVDTIDPDSIRVTGNLDYDNRKCFIHFNKQAVRDYYRIIHEKWYDSINDAKKKAKTDRKGRNFMEIYNEFVSAGDYPGIPEYDGRFSQIQSKKYAMIVAPFLEENFTQENINAETLDVMKQEIEFYKSMGKLERYLKETSIANPESARHCRS